MLYRCGYDVLGQCYSLMQLDADICSIIGVYEILYHSVESIKPRYEDFFKYLNEVKVGLEDIDLLNIKADKPRVQYRIIGKTVTKEQATDIIRRSDIDLCLHMDTSCHYTKVISTCSFLNNWLGLGCRQHFGWCHPDGIIGLNSTTGSRVCMRDYLIDCLVLAYHIPYLEMMIVITDCSDKNVKGVEFQDIVCFGFYIHKGQVDILKADTVLKGYNHYLNQYGVRDIKNPGSVYSSNNLQNFDKLRDLFKEVTKTGVDIEFYNDDECGKYYNYKALRDLCIRENLLEIQRITEER